MLRQSSGDDRLTQQRLKELLRYDSETGVFKRAAAVRGSKSRVDSEVGTRHSDGCIVIRIDRVLHKAHRLAFLYMTGSFPAGVVDHINGIRSDNRWSNLRDVPQCINCANRHSAQTNNRSTGILGVHAERGSGRFIAHITVRGKYKNLGRFHAIEQAIAARSKAKTKVDDAAPTTAEVEAIQW